MSGTQTRTMSSGEENSTKSASGQDSTKLEPSIIESSELDSNIVEQEARSLGAIQLTPDLVRSAYMLFLDRNAESDVVVTRALSHGSVRELRAAMISSSEFRRKNPLKLNNLPLELPRLSIESDPETSAQITLFEHIQSKWTKLGAERPYWSVLSSPVFEREVTPDLAERFYASGLGEMREVQSLVHRAGRSISEFSDVVEYGCGLGRMTLQLAKSFARVIGIDISPAHLDLARTAAASANVANIDFRTSSLPNLGMTSDFDFWYSRIVLQHNPPPLIKYILHQALTMLRPGGMAVFQVPTHSVGYTFELKRYMQSRKGAGDIEMHCLPQRDVLNVVAEAGCVVCEVREDRSVNIPEYWISNTFVVEKR